MTEETKTSREFLGSRLGFILLIKKIKIMSIKFNENRELTKLKEEILAQMKIEQKQYAENLEEKMEETNKLIEE